MAALKGHMQPVKNGRLGTGDIVFIKAEVVANTGPDQKAILIYTRTGKYARGPEWAHRDTLWKYVITDTLHQEVERRNGAERRQDFNRAWTTFQARRVNTQERRKSWPR